MKTLTVLCLLFISAYAFPAYSDEDSDEMGFFEPVERKTFPFMMNTGDVKSGETDHWYPSILLPIFRHSFPAIKIGGFSSHFPDSIFKKFSSFVPGVPSDAKVTNAVSTTKIIDNHKITVNSTTYENDKNGAVYKYQVIRVTNVDDSGSSEESEEAPRPTEEPPQQETEQTPKQGTEEPPQHETEEPSNQGEDEPPKEDKDETLKQGEEEPPKESDSDSLDNEIPKEEVSPPDESDDLQA